MADERTSRTDADLLARARDGDRGALDELLERTRPRLLDRVRLMMGEPARRIAESGDFLQGLYLEVLEGLDRSGVADEEQFVRWATGVARNNIRDEVRRKRERTLESFARSGILSGGTGPGPTPSQGAALGEEVERLISGLEELSHEHREIVELRDFDGLSFRAIAERIGRTENAAQLLHARALMRLGGLLQRG